MKRTLLSASLSFVLTVLAGCTAENPKLVGVPPGSRKAIGGYSPAINPVVDILFIIDDSLSMDGHQQNLSSNINLFVDELVKNTKLDYHIGVITTSDSSWSSSDGGYLQGMPKVVDKSTPNGRRALARNLLVGVGGDGTEKVFSPGYKALSPPLVNTVNAGFLRPDAYLAIVVVTDAEDQSSTLTPQDFYDFLLTLKNGDTSKVFTYGAYIPESELNCQRDQTGTMPLRLTELFNISKGVTFSLCDFQFGAKLAQVGKDLVRKIETKVLLDRRPIISSISVNFGSQVIPSSVINGWVYNVEDNSVSFGPELVWSAQSPGTLIEVNYEAERTEN